jgi:hypothetical protein
MRIKTNIVKLLAVLAILGSLVAIAAVPAIALDPAVTPTPNPAVGSVGDSISIKAENYPAGAVLTAKFDGSTMSTSPATVTVPTPSVAVTFTVTIPVTTAGAHQIIVYQDGMNPLTIVCTVTPKITITAPASKKGPVGTSVTVSGTGFSGAGVTADVRIGTTGLDTTDKMLVAGVLVDNTGSFTAAGNVPQLGSGNQFVWARDGQNNNSATSLQSWNTFKVTPTLVITPSSGLAGSKVTLSGSGWNPGAITFKFGGVNWVGVTATADGNGQITLATGADKVIPTSAGAGIKVVEGTDTAAQSGTFNFTVTPRVLTLTPSSGPMGTNVLVTGSDMTHDGTIAAGSLTFGGNNWNTYPGVSPYPINIDTSGSLFPTTLTVPTGATLGANNVVAIDSGTLIAAGAFTVTKPTIAVSPTTSPKGTTVTITGAGWLPNKSVTIDFKAFGSAVVLSTLTTIPDGTGNIAASMAVPATAATGANTISAYDAKGNSATDATYTVPGAAITVTPTEGSVTTSVTVAGTGFNPYFSVIITMGPAPAYEFQMRPLSDATGAFSATITIPGLAPGSQVITAKDGTNTATAFFVIKQGTATVQTQTASISSQLVRVWGYSGGTWSMYDPTDAAGSNLTTLKAGNGYWVNVNAACTLISGGYSYALSTGWNLIGWR